MPPPRIRRVLFDAFGTLFSPRTSVYIQYTEVAQKYGLDVTPDAVKQGFKHAFGKWNSAHPLYGKLSISPLTPSIWWTQVILETFQGAGVLKAQLEAVTPQFTEELIQRFWSQEGYSLHSDVSTTLTSLSHLLPLPPAVVSGSDPGAIKVLESLGVIPASIASRDVFTTWGMEREKTTKGFWEGVLKRMNSELEDKGQEPLLAAEVLVVGDELLADYETPISVGMQALLLRRVATSTQELARASYGGADLDQYGNAHGTIASLEQIIPWLEQRL